MRRFSKESFVALFLERSGEPYDYNHYSTVFKRYDVVLLTIGMREYELFHKWFSSYERKNDCEAFSSFVFDPINFILFSKECYVNDFEEFVHAQVCDNRSDLDAE